jgi:hypothetical protein
MHQQARVMARGSLRRAVQVVVVCCGLVLAAIPAVPAAAGATPPGCPAPAVGQVSCGALVTPASTAVTNAAMAAAATTPAGLSPADLQAAYGLEFSALTGGWGRRWRW